MSAPQRTFMSLMMVLCLFEGAQAVDKGAQSDRAVALKTALNHPMQYFLSLPTGWSARKKWPVVIVIEGSGKDFRDMALSYVHARKNMPFIIVVPLVLTNGGRDLRSLPNYHYSSDVWDEVDRTSRCNFDIDGLNSIIEDLKTKYAAQGKVFLTGFSAGGHLTWAMVFQRPEKLAAVALAGGNYVGRCMDDGGKFSEAPERITLPVKEFEGRQDSGRANLEKQFQRALASATEHGYHNISLEVVSGGHDPLENQVLAYFYSMLKTEKGSLLKPSGVDSMPLSELMQ